MKNIKKQILHIVGTLYVTSLRFIKKHPKKTALVAVLLLWYAFILPRPLFDDPTSLVLSDRKGDLLGAQIAADGQWRFPITQAVPEKFEAAILAFEDKRFYYHFGIDPIGIGRALVQNFRAKRVESGGSTITMQVIRLARKGKSRNLWQKMVEAVLATRLELGYKKSTILKLYAANAPFGGNVVGIEAASWRYFGKSPALLSWGEAATLAVLPNAPALIHPARNRAALLNKRNRLLDKLQKNGNIDAVTCELAKTENLPAAPLPLPQLAPHLLDRAFANISNSKNQENTNIQTTIDKYLQQRVLEIVQQQHYQLSGNGIHNIAAFVMDVETGKTLAYVGNVRPENGNKEHGQAVDVVTARRSTGSLLKPFLYALILDEGKILPTTLLPDIPIQFNSYRPENYAQTYDGAIPAHRALSRSLNVPFVRLLQWYGLEKFHYKLKQLGMTTVDKSATHYGLPLILGGAEGSLWEMTGVYASMARTLNHSYTNNGLYSPYDFRGAHYLAETEIPTPSERELTKAPPILSAASIYQTFEAMLEVERPNEDGSWDIFQSRKRIAWKTGTSFGFRDAWAIGVTPQYAVGVWVGNADGEGRPDLIGVRVAAPILFDIFNILKTPKWFDQPFDEMIRLPICKESGFSPKTICQNVDTIWATAAAERTPPCPFHRLIHLDANGDRVHSDCAAPSEMQHRAHFVLPPVEEFYYKKNNPSYTVLPPYRQDCALTTRQGNPLRMIYPNQKNVKIIVPRELDGSLGKTVFKAAHRKPQTTIYWHLDHTYLGSTQAFHEFELQPPSGKHLLTLVDENGQSLRFSFEVLGEK